MNGGVGRPRVYNSRMIEPPKNDDSLRVSILLAQYEACATHHIGYYGLIWQVPAVAIAIGGV